MLTRHILAHFSSKIRSRSGLATDAEIELEENKPMAMTQDKKNVSDLIGYIHSNNDPLNVADHPKLLINTSISTEMKASINVHDSLLKSIEHVNQMVKSFVEGCSNKPETHVFYSPMSRSPRSTFDDTTENSKLKCKSGDFVKAHINPAKRVRRALVLANIRKIDSIVRIVAYPIGPIPSALFYDDSTMTKCSILEEDDDENDD
ncbi:Hypothetical predicted protein [Mytilus galloprovincialis]|uniref:Uncharacterized protein n=1 Tax=Mytilus galloprovincialis TaxID=29158 RepID=A0A8B6CT95_MYTGA|nr:Hypothetical predicted protein [Mytilus galloprovincialis]